MYLANAKRHLRKQALHSRNAVQPVMDDDSTSTSEASSMESAMERFSSSVGEAWDSMLALFSPDDAQTSEYTASEDGMDTVSSTDAHVSDAEVESAMMESDAMEMTASPVETAIVEESDGDSIQMVEDTDEITVSDSVDTTSDDNAATHAAKRMYVVIKIAMAGIAGHCVAALQWISSGISALASPRGASAIFAEFPSATASTGTTPSSSSFGSSISSSAPPTIILGGGALQSTPASDPDAAYDEVEGYLPEGFTSSMFMALGDALYSEIRATPVPPRAQVISREAFQNVGDSLYRAMLSA